MGVGFGSLRLGAGGGVSLDALLDLQPTTFLRNGAATATIRTLPGWTPSIVSEAGLDVSLSGTVLTVPVTALATGTVRLRATDPFGILAFERAFDLAVIADPAEPPAPPAPPITFDQFTTTFAFGVNLSGLQYERADPALAQLDGAPIRPLDWKWDYLAAKGVRLVRLPFLWEHTQPRLYGPLGMAMGGYSTNVGDPDRNSLQMIRSQVAKAAARGIKVVLECKNYGARAIPDANGSMAARGGYGKDGKYAIGSAEVPHAAFADFWSRMAAEFKNDPTVVGFDIMNEPTKMIAGESWATIPQGGPVWTEAARQAILAIRAAGAPQWIIVEGYSFATTGFWVRSNPDLHTLKGVDPFDRLMFSPHLYFDGNHAGTYLGGEATAPADFDADMARMQANVAAFQGWLTDKGISRVFVGETGAPNTPAWQEIQRRFLAICRDRAWPVTLWGMWPNGEGEQNVNDLTPIGGTKGVGATDTIALRTLQAFIDAADPSEGTVLFPVAQALPEAPDGQTFLTDSDGAYLVDDDGAYLTEISA